MQIYSRNIFFNYSKRNPQFGNAKIKLNAQQTKNLLDLLYSGKKLKEIKKETGLSIDFIRKFCKEKLGKNTIKIRREALYERFKNQENFTTIAEDIGISLKKAKELEYGARSILKSKLKFEKKQDKIIKLWEEGHSIEEIAKSTKESEKTIFDFLCEIAKEKGPYVG